MHSVPEKQSHAPGGGSHAVDEAPALPTAPNPSPATLRRVALGAVVVLGALLALGLLPRRRHQAALEEASARTAAAPPRVLVGRPKAAAANSMLTLPGSIDALRAATIYARTSGYLKQRLVDIGDTVKEGQLLAVIDTPEVDQQLDQAKATLEQSKAAQAQARTNLEFARISLSRARELAPSGVVSQQDFDQRTAQHDAETANLRAAQATIDANAANVRRLTDLKAFSRVVAPFAGTITERDVDVGALITSGNGTGQSLFKIAASNPVRVFVSVPQSLSTSVHQGSPASVTVREHEGRTFSGRVTRDAHAIDVRSRTLLTEVQVPNDDGALLPGMYAQVTFHVANTKPSLLIDGSALVSTVDGPKLAIVGADDKVRLRPVTVDVDYGAQIAISQGLTAGDRVVLNADGKLEEGLRVEPIENSPAKPAAK